jgi:hypothetical protein
VRHPVPWLDDKDDFIIIHRQFISPLLIRRDDLQTITDANPRNPWLHLISLLVAVLILKHDAASRFGFLTMSVLTMLSCFMGEEWRTKRNNKQQKTTTHDGQTISSRGRVRETGG